MGKQLRVGIIGTGSISHMHITSYEKNENAEIIALCDIDEKRLKTAADKYGIEKTYADYRRMFAECALDAVSVCTWNSQHAPCAIAALEAGLHVLCEKPMAINRAEAETMREAAERSGKLLMIGFVRRFGNDCRVLKDFINNGDLGEIYYAKTTYIRRFGCPGGWYGDKARSGGGPLIDLGVHVIDLTRYLMGNPKPVSVYAAAFDKLLANKSVKDAKGYRSATKSNNNPADVEDMVSALVRYDNGAVLNIVTSFALNVKEDEGLIELMGTKGGAKLNPNLEIFTEKNGYMVNIGFNTPTALSFNGLFENEVNHFVDCALNGSPCLAPAGDGVVVMRIIDAIYESAQTKREVVINNN
ncbi:MAG: Gfo/Idh/MocA family oxidoreductase [Clostridiales bacterium]|jgi:predicted dehydrogenase|nr:Gfo/Idh/MocA family oxidoreductase [Clostridiales bacterium]